MKRLPIGIQEFSKLRNQDLLYVDKTAQILELLKDTGYYFLSRPRRFGKSLLISTLKEIFSGNRDLFKGLYIEDKIAWEKHPVIHLDFSDAQYRKLGLEESIFILLKEQANLYDLTLESRAIGGQLKELILKLYKKYEKQVVFLIDEYDKPIIDFLGKHEVHIAEENRDTLKEFYAPVKSLDKYLRFFFLTGVSRFSKVTIFSDLNHLKDLTTSKMGYTLVGYTEEELHLYFKDYITQIADNQGITEEQLKRQVKEWYNGYSFGGERLYNPFSILNFMDDEQFNNYWFATGTPTFLVKLMVQNWNYDISNTVIDLLSLGNFNIQKLEEIPILFQTGYLTLAEHLELDLYRLDYPNKEVKNAMVRMLLKEFSYQDSSQSATHLIKIKQCLVENDLENVFVWFNSLFANIPNLIFDKNKENYYHSILFLIFELLGFYIDAEVNTSKGRIDAVVITKDTVFIFEFKVNDSAENALAQIKDRKYYEKYLLEKEQGKKVLLVGVACREKTISEYTVEEI